MFNNLQISLGIYLSGTLSLHQGHQMFVDSSEIKLFNYISSEFIFPYQLENMTIKESTKTTANNLELLIT